MRSGLDSRLYNNWRSVKEDGFSSARGLGVQCRFSLFNTDNSRASFPRFFYWTFNSKAVPKQTLIVLFWGSCRSWNTSSSHCDVNPQWCFMCLIFIHNNFESDLFYCLKMKLIFFYYSYFIMHLVPLHLSGNMYLESALLFRTGWKSIKTLTGRLWMIHKTICFIPLKCSMFEQGRNLKLSSSNPVGVFAFDAPFYQHPSSAVGQQKNLHRQPMLNLPSERIHSLIKYSPATAGSQLPAAIKHTSCLVLVACYIYFKKHRP